MKKTQNLIAVILFCAVIVTMPVISALLPREHKSDYENRTLATFPTLSVKTLFNGSFVAGVEDYLTDFTI